MIGAALRSGSLITAREAAYRGTEVMPLPVSPLDPRSRGTNGLIRDGTTLVQNIDDILSVLSQANNAEISPPSPHPISRGYGRAIRHSFCRGAGRYLKKNYSKTSLMTQLRLTNCVSGVMSLQILCNLFYWNWSWQDRVNAIPADGFPV